MPEFPNPQSIDAVLEELDRIIAECVSERNYLSIFAWVYRRTTAAIKKGVEDGRFLDGARMEKFDVRFARYYIDAYYGYRAGQPVSQSWALTFDARNEQLTVLQHLMMGMNAHINLDLGVTAATTRLGNNMAEIEADFMVVNDILNELVNEMQSRISRISPAIFLLDWIGQNNDEKVADFAMRKARGTAWSLACLLEPQDENTRSISIQEADKIAAQLGKILKNPAGRLLRYVLKIVSWLEEKDPEKVLKALSD